MDLFTYLMAKNGNNSSVHGDLFSYLLGKGQSQTYTVSGTTIYIPDAKKLVSFMMTKESTQATSILPSGYTQVDYIESHGTEYIDLNITANQNTNFNVQFKTLDSVIASRSFFGYLNDDNVNANDYFLYVSVMKKFQFGFNGYRNFEDVLTNTFYNVYNDKNKLYINGNEYTIPYSGDFSTSPNSLYLFKIRNVAANGTPIQLFSFKLFDNGTIVRDMIPCYRNSDNVVGLYDLVNDVFYTNQGTGAFTYGSVASIPNPDYPQEVNVVEGYRNLFDKDNATVWNGYVNANHNKTYSNSERRSIVWSCEKNTTYTISKRLSSHFRVGVSNTTPSNNMTLLSSIENDSGKSITIATGESGVYLIIAYYWEDDTLTEQEILDSIMIIEGDQEQPYVPYGNNYIAVNISDGTNTNKYPIPLNNNIIAGIGDYKDELKVDKSGHVFINKKTGKVVLDGSESITYSSGSAWKFRYTIQDANFTNTGNEKGSLLNNYFQVGVWNSSQNNQMATRSASPKLVGIRFDDMTSLDDFKTWLSTHNTEVYYPLETPELIDLQTTVDINLFKGVNNVSNSEDGYMTIEYR